MKGETFDAMTRGYREIAKTIKRGAAVSVQRRLPNRACTRRRNEARASGWGEAERCSCAAPRAHRPDSVSVRTITRTSSSAARRRKPRSSTSRRPGPSLDAIERGAGTQDCARTSSLLARGRPHRRHPSTHHHHDHVGGNEGGALALGIDRMRLWSHERSWAHPWSDAVHPEGDTFGDRRLEVSTPTSRAHARRDRLRRLERDRRSGRLHGRHVSSAAAAASKATR